MSRGTDLDNVNTGSNKRAKISDKIPVFKFPEKKWVTLRVVGAIFTYAGYSVTTKNKDGKKVNFYTPCPSYDPKTQQRDSGIYDPWRDLEASQSDVAYEDRLVRLTQAGFVNAILRKAQKDKPRKVPKVTKKEAKTGFKETDSDSWTPYVPVRFPKGAIGKLKDLTGLNTVEKKGQTKTYSVADAKYGCDVRVMFDPSKAPADQYQVQIGERSPLTEEELEYLKYDLDNLEEAAPEAEVRRDFESWATRNGVKVKKAKKSKDEDDEDLDDDDGDDDDEDEPKSKKSKKAAKVKSKKSKDDDDEDEDDEDEDEDLDDDDEDDEDEKPAKKSKKPVKSAKSKKSKDEDDEDEDDEDLDDDEDDEDDEKPSKKSKAKKPVKGKKSKDEDEDDDDEDLDDDEDDDEDDEPKAKKSKGKKSKKSKDEDDEDDEDEDDDLDDDEEDEKPAKKSKKKKR